MANRNRSIQLKFFVSEAELEQIKIKMEQYSTNNLSAYLRKIAIDGYVVNLELPELGEMVSLLRRSSNNLNQLTKRVHETGLCRPVGGGAENSFFSGKNPIRQAGTVASSVFCG